MNNSEIEIFNLIKNKYMFNEKEILCAAYLHNPTSYPSEYLIINSFMNKKCTSLTKKEELIFLMSRMAPLEDKIGFLKFMNSKNKINASILSKVSNIREEKYKNLIWQGSIFLAPKRNLIGKIGIELYYDKYLSDEIENPFKEEPRVNFKIIETKMLSNPYKPFILHLDNKFIL